MEKDLLTHAAEDLADKRAQRKSNFYKNGKENYKKQMENDFKSFARIKDKLDILGTIPNAEEILSPLNLQYESFNIVREAALDSFEKYRFEMLLIELKFETIMRARKKDPLYGFIGCLYLNEVYEELGLRYRGDRNIGITSDDYSWRKLNSSVLKEDK